MRKLFSPIITTLLLFCAVSCSSSSESPEAGTGPVTPPVTPPTPTAEYIRVESIEGQHWLVTSDDKPIFVHGINHIDSEKDASAEDILAEMREMGFNTYGYGTPDEMTLKNDLPFFVSMNDLVFFSMHLTDAKFEMYDLFDPAVGSTIDSKIGAECSKFVNNKQLIGYYWTDMPSWNLEKNTKRNWILFTQSLEATAPMKVKYVEFLKGRYSSFATFNSLYKTSATSWESLKSDKFAALPTNDKIAEDSQEYLKIIATQYYKILGEATKKHDPNHLIFGDRYALASIDYDVIDAAIDYIDVISFQPPYATTFPTSDYNAVYNKYKKPIMICDYAVRYDDGVHTVQSSSGINEKAATDGYVSYVSAAFNTKYVLGVSWCTLCDLDKGDFIKQGFFTKNLGAREHLHPAVKALNSKIQEETPEGI